MATTTIGGISTSSTVAADADLREIEQGGVTKKEANSVLRTYMINPPPNLQTGTTYTYAATDNGKLVSHSNAAAIAGTLPVAGGAFITGWWTNVQNRGAGTLTITPTTSTIDGVSSLVLLAGQGCRIVSDGANYYTQRGSAGLALVAMTGAKADVGLSNVDNTSDANKPVSSATQTALNGKEPTITAGSISQYFKGDKSLGTFATDVLNVALAGLSTATATAITATDTILAALGKVQAQVSNKLNSDANAVSATKLATARNINGVAFDGTANITVADSTKELTIAAGTTSQYWRGDKSWQTLAADVRSAALTGLSTATATAITATDSVLSSLGKLQAQVTVDTDTLSIVNDFKASRWHFYDFSSAASQFGGNFATSLISGGTLANNTVVIDGAYGAATFSSSATANSGGSVNETATTPLSAGLVTRSMFYLAATQATRVIRMGFTASGAYVSAAENNGVYCEVLDNVVKAWTSTGGTTTSQGSANIPTGALITCDVEIKSATNVRLVVFNSVTLVKYLDETITTNIPAFTNTLTLPCLKAWSTGTTAIGLVTVDYIGIGLARPTYIKTPA